MSRRLFDVRVRFTREEKEMLVAYLVEALAIINEQLRPDIGRPEAAIHPGSLIVGRVAPSLSMWPSVHSEITAKNGRGPSLENEESFVSPNGLVYLDAFCSKLLRCGSNRLVNLSYRERHVATGRSR